MRPGSADLLGVEADNQPRVVEPDVDARRTWRLLGVTVLVVPQQSSAVQQDTKATSEDEETGRKEGEREPARSRDGRHAVKGLCLQIMQQDSDP